MNFSPILLTLIVIVCSILGVTAQCDVTLGTIIEDVSSGSIEIFVDGATNDNLFNEDQGLCGVELYFEHTSIQDIFISLESPAGQEITLVGPATGAGGNTQFTYWGIEFVRCDTGTVMPDLPILDDIFTTEDNWGIFGNYIGQYYPQQGCLDDFNTGSVNGIWTVNFEDVQLFDTGAIDSIALIFCDDTNLYCLECLADGGTLSEVPSDYCESDPDLNLDIEPIFDEAPPIEEYNYDYLIVQNGEVIEINSEPDLTAFSFGSYQVCGLSTLDLQTEDILNSVIGAEYIDLPDSFLDNEYCASLSLNCLDINIIEVSDTILITDTICLGDFLILDGNEYSETGEYVISFSQAFCDSVSILDLIVIDNQAEIVADSDAISCLDGDVVLDASSSIFSPSTVLSWFRVDGEIDPLIESDLSITVTEPGFYGLSLITGICADTAYFEVINDESIPSFTFNIDTITCYNPTVIIDMTPSVPLQNVQWTGPISADTEDIEVGIGTYYVAGVAFNGCVGIDSIEIQVDLDVIDPIISGDTITCLLDTANIIAFLPQDFSFMYNWTGPNMLSGIDNDTVLVTQDTTYILTLQSLDNGCIEEFEYTVQIDTARAEVDITSTILNCAITEAEIVANSIMDSIQYYWEYEDDSFVGDTDTISTMFGGVYQVFATSTNGCVDSFYHSIFQDTIPPLVTVDTIELTCLLDSIPLISVTSETDLSYLWNGPDMFQSTDSSPFVTNPGTYVLEVLDSSGCVTVVTGTVIPGAGLPNLTFMMSDVLDCNVDVITITPSDTTNLAFDWQSDLISNNSSAIIDVVQSDLYPLMITDTITGCSAFYEIFVPSNYSVPNVVTTVPIIGCNSPSVVLETDVISVIDSLHWSNDQGFGTDEYSPTITMGAEYYLFVRGINGCIYKDTVLVLEDLNLPIINTDVPLLDCINDEVTISYTTNDNTDTLRIRLMDGSIVDQSELLVNTTGTYMAIATTSTGCTDSVEMQVIQDINPPIVSLVTNGIINCTNTTTTILVDSQESGLAFVWTGVSIVSPLGLDSIIVDSEGLFSVEVVDSANCVTTLDIDIESFIDFPIVTNSATDINCTSDQAELTLEVPDNTILVEWSGPSAVDNNTLNFLTDTPGTYIALVTADNNCITESMIEVVVDTLVPMIDVLIDGILDCDTESIAINGQSNATGSSFSWIGPNQEPYQTSTIQVTQPGIYNLTVTAPNTCVRDTLVEVESDTLRPTIVTGPSPIFRCDESKIFLTIETDDNVVTYDWEGPFGSSIEPEPLAVAPGLYTVTVTNDLGCTTSAEINVIDDTAGPELIARDTFITCNLLPVFLPLTSLDVDVTFEWEGPNFESQEQNPFVDVIGEYIVYAILDRNQCVSIDTVNVMYQETPPIFDAEYGNINCNKSEVMLRALDVQDDISASWTDENYNVLAQDSFLVTTGGTYNLIVIAENECLDTLEAIVIEDFEDPEFIIDLNEPFECDNTGVTLQGSVILPVDSIPISTQWTTQDGLIIEGNNDINVMISGEGTYILSIINIDNGCISRDSITLMEAEQSLENLTIVGEDPICLGDFNGSIAVTEIVGGYPPFGYSINGSVLQTDSVFNNLPFGDYTIEIVDSVGCTLDMEIDLLDGFDFQVFAESDTFIVVGDTVELNSVFNLPDNEIATTKWSANKGDYECDDCFIAPVNPLFNTIFTLHATSIDGCQGSSQVFVQVNRNPNISVANVFAPSSENNALFYIQQTRGIERVLSMSVFDKWASRMYYIENAIPGDSSIAWDGTYRGRDVNPGVYVVVAELLLFSGEVVTYAGDITVLR